MMLKLFVILVFAAVVFGDSSSTSSLMTSVAKQKSTTPMLTNTTVQTTTAASTATATQTLTLMPTVTAMSTATTKPNTTAASTTTPTTSTPASKTMTPHSTILPKPTKTTTPPPTTTPHPTTPSPPSGNFSLRDKKTGNYCILARFDAFFTIELHYILIKDNKTSIWNKTLRQRINSGNDAMRDDVEVKGDCGENGTDASLVLLWPKNNESYRLTMDFQISPSDNTTWMVRKITFNVTLKNNPDLSPPPGLNASSVLGTYNPPSGQLGGQVGGYYLCDSNTSLPLTTNVTNITLTSQFENVRLEPFVNKKSALDFGKDKTECEGKIQPNKGTKGNDNNIVPIAVGCALAGLVLIVLIAYVIGRRKSHSGYEKV